MKLRVQIGYESVPDSDDPGKRDIRVTPYDREHDLKDDLAAIVLLVASGVDATDSQKGDGEIDIPLGITPKDLIDRVPMLGTIVDGFGDVDKGNVFIKIRKV